MVAPGSFRDRLLHRGSRSTVPNPTIMAVLGFVAVSAPFLFLSGIVPELLRRTLILHGSADTWIAKRILLEAAQADAG
jgi:hypothetical protein